MRVLHISTTDLSGGAARAAWNLVEGLRAAGCDARMLVKNKCSTAEHVLGLGPAGADFTVREDLASLVKRKLINPDRDPISNSWFSLGEPALDISRHEEVQKADLLHLHWVSGFLSPSSINALQATGKPTVWSLHDQRPFTGACHFSAGCTRFERDCAPCALLLKDPWRIPAEGLAESLRQIAPEHLHVLCPSRWMAGCAKASALFRSSTVHVVPYGVDTSAFQPRSSSARAGLGVKDDELLFLAGADQSGELRKGLRLLGEALTGLGASREKLPKLMLFGAAEPPQGFNYPAQCLGRIDSQVKLAELYSAADAFLLTSTEDNLPNTMLEALCCGTPVIGFDVGGVPDVVVNRNNGLLVKSVSAGAYADALRDFCRDPDLRACFDRGSISKAAREAFSRERQATSVLMLYGSMINSRPAFEAPRQPSQGETSSRIARPTDAFAVTFSGWVREARKQQWKQRWQKLSRKLSLGRATGKDLAL